MKVTQKNLMKVWPKLSKKDALTITRLVNGTLDPENFKEGQRRVNECYHKPDSVHLVLTVINKMVGGFGVEGVPYEVDAIYSRDFINYINLGDTYYTTLVHSPVDGFLLTSWGSVYEDSPACRQIDSEDQNEDI